jgi:hypothetical protein
MSGVMVAIRAVPEIILSECVDGTHCCCPYGGGICKIICPGYGVVSGVGMVALLERPGSGCLEI